MEMRRYHRVKFSAPAVLVHREMRYEVSLENVCLRGALVSATGCLMVPVGETCTLTVPGGVGNRAIEIAVQVIHGFFSMAGLEFVAFGEGSEESWYRLMQGITPRPDKLLQEWNELHDAR